MKQTSTSTKENSRSFKSAMFENLFPSHKEIGRFEKLDVMFYLIFSIIFHDYTYTIIISLLYCLVFNCNIVA